MAQSAHNRYALGVDIGGSHVCSAVVDLATGATVRGTAHGQSRRGSRGPHDRRGLGREHPAHGRGSGIGRIPVRGFAFPGAVRLRAGHFADPGRAEVRAHLRARRRGDALPAAAECGTEEFRYVNDAAAFALANASAGSRTTPNA